MFTPLKIPARTEVLKIRLNPSRMGAVIRTERRNVMKRKSLTVLALVGLAAALMATTAAVRPYDLA